MIVAGDHATNDMAGDDEDSWYTQFKDAGFEVECILKGLGNTQRSVLCSWIISAQ